MCDTQPVLLYMVWVAIDYRIWWYPRPGMERTDDVSKLIDIVHKNDGFNVVFRVMRMY